LIVQPQHRLR